MMKLLLLLAFTATATFAAELSQSETSSTPEPFIPKQEAEKLYIEEPRRLTLIEKLRRGKR